MQLIFNLCTKYYHSKIIKSFFFFLETCLVEEKNKLEIKIILLHEGYFSE